MTPDRALRLLSKAGVPDPATDVRRLFDWAYTRVGAEHGDQTRENPNEATMEWFDKAIHRRCNREPVSQIIGRRDFWKGWFQVSSDVLDPRPDTEILVETALNAPFSKVLDLGTGSGCIVISLLSENAAATGVGIDISAEALKIAEANALYHNVSDRLTLRRSDWYDGLEDRFDLIVSNPPYIALTEMDGLQPEVRDHEPRIALTDEADGLAAYRKITGRALGHLVPEGRLLVEIGPTQANAVTAMFKSAGLEKLSVHSDLDGRDRVVSGQAPAR